MTNVNQQLMQLSAVIERAISLGAGFEEAESLYSELFRSPESVSILENPELLDEAIDFLCADVYPSCDHGEHSEYYDPEPIAVGMIKEDAVKLVESGIRFVETCNYKGEGCGIIPECLTKGMRVFVSKHNYMQ